MTTCIRCGAEPRHGSSELGVRCLWPEPETPEAEARRLWDALSDEDKERVFKHGAALAFPESTLAVRLALAGLATEREPFEPGKSCVRCRNAPRIHGSAFCSPCEEKVALMDRVIRVTTVRTAAPVPQVLSVHTQVEHAADAHDAHDAGSTPRPTPPCCARVGSWWCLREAGHEPPCWTPHTREVTTPAIERGTRSPR